MKYNKGFAPVLIVLIVVGALAIGGGAYYVGKNKGEDKKIGESLNIENENNNKEAESINQVNKNVEKKSTKTQVNINAGYKVDYPADWYVKSSDTKISSNGNYGYNAFVIQNTKDAVLPGSDFSMKINGSRIDVSVDTNMNYLNYEEFIKDPKTDLPKSAKEERIANLEMINIGGKTLQGLNAFRKSTTGGSYVFIYNKKQYSIGIVSGSESQFIKDKKIFDDMVSSFKFIDSEESSITKNDVINQPAYLKSVYVKNGKNYIDVDYIQMFATLEEEKKAAVEDGFCDNIATCNVYNNGYKRNSNPLIRTFEVSLAVIINVYGEYNQYLNNGNLNSSNSLMTFNQLKEYKEKSENYKQYIHYIVLDVKDNKVIKIIEPYQE